MISGFDARASGRMRFFNQFDKGGAPASVVGTSTIYADDLVRGLVK